MDTGLDHVAGDRAGTSTRLGRCVDHLQVGKSGDPMEQIVADHPGSGAYRFVDHFRVNGEDGEDRRLERQRGIGRPMAAIAGQVEELIDVDLFGNVLQVMTAHRPEPQCRLIERLVHTTRNGEASGRRDRLDPGGDVEGVAVVVPICEGDLPLVHSHPEPDLPRADDAGVAFLDLGRDGDSGAQPGHGIVEDGHEAVADEVGERAAVLCHPGFDYLVVLGHGRGGGFEVVGNQSAVANNVGVERHKFAGTVGIHEPRLLSPGVESSPSITAFAREIPDMQVVGGIELAITKTVGPTHWS